MMNAREKATLEHHAEKEIALAKTKGVPGLAESLTLMFKACIEHYDEQEPYDYDAEDYEGPW